MPGGPERWLRATVVQADGFLATLAESRLQFVTPGLLSLLETLGAVGQAWLQQGAHGQGTTLDPAAKRSSKWVFFLMFMFCFISLPLFLPLSLIHTLFEK